MLTQYQRGYAFENRVIAELERDGYRCVRAAGSKGKADVVALKPGQVLLVQVKITNPQLSPLERRELHALAMWCGALPIVAYRTKPRGPIALRQLTGTGPKDWVPFYTDEVITAFGGNAVTPIGRQDA